MKKRAYKIYIIYMLSFESSFYHLLLLRTLPPYQNFEVVVRVKTLKLWWGLRVTILYSSTPPKLNAFLSWNLSFFTEATIFFIRSSIIRRMKFDPGLLIYHVKTLPATTTPKLVNLWRWSRVSILYSNIISKKFKSLLLDNVFFLNGSVKCYYIYILGRTHWADLYEYQKAKSLWLAEGVRFSLHHLSA